MRTQKSKKFRNRTVFQALKGMLILCIVFFMMTKPLSAQGSVNIETDIVSNFVWRGQVFSATPNIQPSISWTSGNESFTVGTWGSFGIADLFTEIDLFVSAQAGGFTFTLLDYFTPESGLSTPYTDWNQRSTGHVLEVLLEYDFNESLHLTWGTFLYGADLDEHEKNAYSTYIEIGWNLEVQSTPVTIFAGFTPWAGFYADKAYPVNLGLSTSKEIKITENYSLPLSGTFGYNPFDDRAFLFIAISL
jgi:hypothetical protein